MFISLFRLYLNGRSLIQNVIVFRGQPTANETSLRLSWKNRGWADENYIYHEMWFDRVTLSLKAMVPNTGDEFIFQGLPPNAIVKDGYDDEGQRYIIARWAEYWLDRRFEESSTWQEKNVTVLHQTDVEFEFTVSYELGPFRGVPGASAKSAVVDIPQFLSAPESAHWLAISCGTAVINASGTPIQNIVSEGLLVGEQGVVKVNVVAPSDGNYYVKIFDDNLTPPEWNWAYDESPLRQLAKGGQTTFSFAVTPDTSSETFQFWVYKQTWLPGIFTVADKVEHALTAGVDQSPVTPQAIFPEDTVEIFTITPQLVWSEFAAGGDDDTQVGFEIRIRDSVTDEIIHSNYVASTVANNYQVPEGALKWSNHYHWHVRYLDSGGQWSAWSADTPDTHQDFYTAQPGTFTIYSDHGAPNPAVGSYAYALGEQMNGGSVVSPVDEARGIRYRCFGYSGTGDASSGFDLSYPSFTINQDSTLTWEWIDQYESISSTRANGSVSPFGSIWMDSGEDVNYTATPDSGYQIDRWEVNSSVVQRGGATYTLSDLSQPSSVTVYFSEIPTTTVTYTVTFDLGSHGTRTGGGAHVQIIEDGQAATAPTISVEDGWNFTGWSVSFSSVTEDLLVAALYEEVLDYFSLTVYSGCGDGSYTNGQVVAISANDPLPGYEFSNWSASPVEYSVNIADTNAVSTTFTMPATNVSLSANFIVSDRVWPTAKNFVDMNDEWAVIGKTAPAGTVNVADVFRKVDGEWVFFAGLDIAEDSTYYYPSDVAMGGNWIGIGVENYITSGKKTGAVFLYEWTGTEWAYRGFVNGSAQDGADFGEFLSFSSSGDYMLVGAISEDNDLGAAYIYSRSGSTWTLSKRVTDYRHDSYMDYGAAVSISDDYAAIGVPDYWYSFTEYDGGVREVEDGEVILYKRSGTSWSLLTRLLSPYKSNNYEEDAFGRQVLVHGQYLFVQAEKSDHEGSGSGGIYVYDLSSGSPQYLKTLEFPKNLFTYLGEYSMSAYGDNLLLSTASGRAVLFHLDDAGQWSLAANYCIPTATGSSVQSLAITSNEVLVCNGSSVFDARLPENIGEGICTDFPVRREHVKDGVNYSLSADDVLPEWVTNSPATVLSYRVAEIPVGVSLCNGEQLLDVGSVFSSDDVEMGDVRFESSTNQYLTGRFRYEVILDDNWTQPRDLYLTVNAPENKITPWTSTGSGGRIAVSDEWAVLTDSGGIGRTYDAGIAYVYHWNGQRWEDHSILSASNGHYQDGFGSAVAIDGNRIVVGADDDCDAAQWAGAAYVYEFDGESWVETGILYPGLGRSDTDFGTDVDLCGDYVIVGTDENRNGYSDTQNDEGAAYIFYWNGSAWIQQAHLRPTSHDDDHAGNYVSMNEDYAFVSSRNRTADNGKVFIYRRSGTTWSLTQNFTGAMDDDALSHCDIAVEGDTAVIGTIYDTGSSARTDAGYARVYVCENGSWVLGATLTPPDGAYYDGFGNYVSTDGENVFVCAPSHLNELGSNGAVYKYSHESGSWQFIEEYPMSGATRIVASTNFLLASTGELVSLQDSYEVIFDLGEHGIWTGGGSLTQQVVSGQTAAEPEFSVEQGWSFDGWSQPFTNVTASITVAAQWSVGQYTLSFDSVGGTAVDPIIQDYGKAISAPADPTREGYAFAGWNPGVPSTMPATNLTLSAQWTINQYTLSFNSAGGTVVTPITQDYGSALATPSNPVRTGYTFAGWNPAVPSTMPAVNQTITAQWTINQYTLTFASDGGTAVDPITQDYGTAVTAPANPMKTGYTFNEWSPAVPATMPATNITLTARYDRIELSVLTGSGTGGAVSPDGASMVLYSDSLPVIITPDTHYHVSDVLVDGSSVGAVTNYVFSNVTNNHTLTASFALDTYQIIFDLGEHGRWTGGGSLTQQVAYGSSAVEPEFDVESGWDFETWSQPFSSVNSEITVAASYLRIDAENSRIAFASDRAGNYDIWKMDGQGSNLVQLTSNELDEYLPTWSRDGSQIAYLRKQSSSHYDLRMMDSDGANDTLITSITNVIGAQLCDWHQNDGVFLVKEAVGNGDQRLFLIDETTGLQSELLNPAIVGDKEVYSAEFSPDQSKLIWASQNGFWSPSLEIFVAPYSNRVVDTGSIVQLTSDSKYDDGAVYSPDQSQICYHHSDAANGYSNPFNIYVMNADGSSKQALTSGSSSSSSAAQPQWSPSGNQILFVVNNQLWMMNADGENQQQLTSDGVNTHPDWCWAVASKDLLKNPEFADDFAFWSLTDASGNPSGRINRVGDILECVAIDGGNYSYGLRQTVELMQLYGDIVLEFDWKVNVRETPYGITYVQLRFLDSDGKLVALLVALDSGQSQRTTLEEHYSTVPEGMLGGVYKRAEVFDWENIRLSSKELLPQLSISDVASVEVIVNAYNDAGSGGDLYIRNLSLSATSGAEDEDADGLPDAWERARFWDTIGAHPLRDNDGDGVDNMQEYVFGTDPTDKADANVFSAHMESGGMSMSVRSCEKRWYTIEGTDDLLNPNWIVLGRFFGNGADMALIDPDVSGLPCQYYRIKAEVMDANPATADSDGDGICDMNDPEPFSKDSDHDGMPDDWETNCSLNSSVSNSLADSDNDGYSDYAEYVFGTRPDNSGSRFFWSATQTSQNKLWAFEVATASNRIYWVDYRVSMTAPWSVIKRFSGNGGTNSFSLTPPDGATGYFRIRATNGNVLQIGE